MGQDSPMKVSWGPPGVVLGASRAVKGAFRIVLGTVLGTKMGQDTPKRSFQGRPGSFQGYSWGSPGVVLRLSWGPPTTKSLDFLEV